ncbi:MAG: DNA polymerase III subunit gamma/tau [Christensenellaceae bacterium]|jgi:DNA polymerase-3 subunit gamma/tau
MAYKTLYRVFRPDTFNDVYGQAHITDILKKQVEQAKPSHAYLFFGPRGTGKTSTAKILANAINCLSPVDGNPCHQCEVCQSVERDAFVDIVEIDAASNNSVDNVRDIREKVSLLPAQGKYKVYIIDEVHMLSSGAFNALLKTLEEPPPHAVFILATTEARKVPATIASRCQRYDFKRISEKDIAARLEEVAKKAGVAYEDEAVRLLAQSAEGAMRDALSLMDQCISGKEKLTAEDVYAAIGAADSKRILALCEAVLEENPKQALLLMDEMTFDGIEPEHILRDMVASLSDLLKKEISDTYKCANILRALEILIHTQSTLRYAAVPAAVLTSALVRAAVNTTDVDTKDFELRIQKLEKRVEKLADKLAKGVPPQPKAEPAPAQTEAAPTREQPPPALKEASHEAPQNKEPENPRANGADKEPGNVPAESLKKFRKVLSEKLPMLVPSLYALKRMDVMDKRVIGYVSEADMPVAEMLLSEAYKTELAEALAEVFAGEKHLELQTETAQNTDDTAQMLIDAFGADNVIIKK